MSTELFLSFSFSHLFSLVIAIKQPIEEKPSELLIIVNLLEKFEVTFHQIRKAIQIGP